MRAEHAIELELPPAEALAALAEAAEQWGGLWQPAIGGGRLELPVAAGLRRGVVRGRVSVEAAAGGSRVALAVEESDWTLHRPAVVILAVGGLGGLFGLVSPFLLAAYPDADHGLARLVPLAGFLAFAAWFLVVSRLRSSGPEEFLRSLAHATP